MLFSPSLNSSLTINPSMWNSSALTRGSVFVFPRRRLEENARRDTKYRCSAPSIRSHRRKRSSASIVSIAPKKNWMNKKQPPKTVTVIRASSRASNALTSSVDWKSEDENNVWVTIGKPTFLKIISSVAVLGVPNMLSVMCEPAVGCVESVLVGRVGALYLAAIAPSSVMFWLIEEVVFALGISLTTVVSEASAARSLISLDELDDDVAEKRLQGNKDFAVSEDTREIVQATVLAAFVLGAVFALAVQCIYAPAMRVLGVFGEAFKLGRLYTAIRCFGLPFFAVAVTFESAYMGEREVMTPLFGFGLGMLSTIIFQVALIHPSYGGLTSVIGAGTAVSIGQLVAAGFLLVRANKQGFFNISQTVRRSSKNLPKLLRKTKSLLIKSELSDSAFWLFCGSASRMLIYTLCTALATQIGVIPAASNKYALDIYFFVCYLIEPLFTLSTILLPKKVKTNKIEAWWMIRILFYLAIFAAIILSCATSLSISLAGHLNLIEPELLKSVTSVKPYVVASVGASSFALALDGIRVGMGGAKNVGQAQVFNLLLTVALAAWMKLYAPGSESFALNHVWVLMLLFQFLRVCEHVYATVNKYSYLLDENR